MELILAWMRSQGLEAIAVAFGIVSVYLSVRQNIWSWPTALVNVALYFLVFRTARLYADMGLQVVYFVLSLYGWYEWLYGGEQRSRLRVSRISWQLAVVLLAIAVLATWQLGSYLGTRTNAALPFMDAGLTCTSLVAQYLMTRKVLENWAIWVAADIVYVGMFIYKQLYLTAGLYTVFLVLAAIGFAQWRRSYRDDRDDRRSPAAVPA